MLTLEDIAVRFGQRAALPTRQWSTLIMSIKDSETDHSYSVEVTALVPRGPDVTMSGLEEATRTSAQATLKAAIDLLADAPISAWRDKFEAAQAQEEAEMQRTFGIPSTS